MVGRSNCTAYFNWGLTKLIDRGGCIYLFGERKHKRISFFSSLFTNFSLKYPHEFIVPSSDFIQPFFSIPSITSFLPALLIHFFTLFNLTTHPSPPYLTLASLYPSSLIPSLYTLKLPLPPLITIAVSELHEVGLKFASMVRPSTSGREFCFPLV